MFRIPAIKFIVDAAKIRAAKIGRLNGSITDGAGNLAGASYEIAHNLLFGGKMTSGEEMYDYDLSMPEGWFRNDPKFGTKLECKSKRRTIKNTDLRWDASIADKAGKGTEQNCDAYTFSSVHMTDNNTPNWIWFMGVIPKKEYFAGRKGNLLQENELDSRDRPVKRWGDLSDGAEFRKLGLPYDENGFICREDCWNRPYSYLYQYKLKDIPKDGIKRLVNILKQARKERWGGPTEFILGQQPDLQFYK